MPEIVKVEDNDETQETPKNVEEDETAKNDAEIVVFADDNTPMIKDENPEELQVKLEQLAKKVTTWFHSNQMIVSGEKTKLIVTSTAANRRNKLGDSLVKVKVDGHDRK